MVSLIKLPAYEVPANAMWNFDPVNKGIDAYQRGAEQTRVAGELKNFGNAMAANNYGDASRAAAAAGEPGVALQAQQFGLTKQKAESDLRHQQVLELGGTAQRILGIPDPAARNAEWARYVQSRPGLAENLTKYGIPANDGTLGAQFVVDQVRGYVNPLDERKTQAQIEQAGAGTNLANAQAELARAQIADGGKTTDLQRNYNFYARQEQAEGRAPKSFEGWQLEQKRAGATAITIDQKGEYAFSKTAGEQQAKGFQELVERGRTARNMIGDLQALRDIGSRIPTGTGKTAEIINALGPYAEALGVTIDGLDNIQAYSAIAARLAPQMRVPGSGATSDFDARQFLLSLPNLGRTPGGNEIISNVFESIQNNQIAAAEIASRALAQEITAREAEKQIRELPDPYTMWKKARGTAPTQTQPGGAPDADGWVTLPGGVRVREKPGAR